jgi:formamidopyrimidine-DNA glycosylase
MPELPECETIVRDLKSIEGKKVIFNRLIDDINFQTPFYKLNNSIIERVERFGKYIIIKFDKSALLIHLAMTGQLFLDKGDYLIPKHCHWLIQLDDNIQLRFVDTRRFGKVWHKSYDDVINYIHSKIGPEIFDINSESFVLIAKQPKYKNRILKDLLLEQKFIAGIGNIYASEICYEAFLNPHKIIHELTDKQLENLYYCIKRVLEKAIKNGGTTISDYRTGNNKKGNNQNFLKAYKQLECKRCKKEVEDAIGETALNYPIKKEKIKDRMTYYCPNCQK